MPSNEIDGSFSGAYLEPIQTSKVTCFAKVDNGFVPLTILTGENCVLLNSIQEFIEIGA